MSPPDSLSLFVRGLRLDAEIGLYPHERGRRQPLVVDIAATLTPSAVTRIDETLDYGELAQAARRLAAEGHIDLVETFAQRLAQACLQHPRVQAVSIRVDKPQAVPDAAGAGVEITMRRT